MKMPLTPSQLAEQDNMAAALDELKLWNQLAPAIHAAIAAGGGNADHILRSSQSLAAVEIVKLLKSEKDDVRLRASTEILNRSLGKPIERRLDLYAEIKDLPEQEIDSRIKQLVHQVGGSEVIDALIAASPKLLKQPRQRIQKRKQRLIDERPPSKPEGA